MNFLNQALTFLLPYHGENLGSLGGNEIFSVTGPIFPIARPHSRNLVADLAIWVSGGGQDNGQRTRLFGVQSWRFAFQVGVL